ncbi:3-hydroxyisobutyrate dehydrogenase [Trinorchestia longiramus]|nr:3-hydroxyisobutyrate dehydrogenase [Trinorchestia longiramus]
MFRTLNRRVLSASFSTSCTHGSKVGFIGLGIMGGPMAENLMKKGHKVVVHDINTEAVDQLVSQGAVAATSPKHVADQCDQLLTMLRNSEQVLQCYTDPDTGVLGSVQTGSLLLDSSTIAPNVSKRVAELAARKGAVYMDAPVSGGVIASKGATLTFMVGGPESEFVAAKELLSCMGKNIVHCGAVGMGQAAKICNNMLLAISMIGTSETMNLGMRLGLDPKLLASILNSSSGRCWSSDTYNPVPGVMPGVPSSNQYQGGFATALVAKDLGLALDAAVSTTSPTPLGGLALQVYRLMAGSGYAEKDFSSVFEFLQERP